MENTMLIIILLCLSLREKVLRGGGGRGGKPPCPGSDAYDMMHVAVKYETRTAFS